MERRISISILSLISGWTEKRLVAVYRQVWDEESNSVPLSEIPRDQQDIYINEYLLRGRLLDVDLLRLYLADPDSRTVFSMNQKTQQLFDDTKLIREALRIKNAYSGLGRTTTQLQRFCKRNNTAYRTLLRKRKLFMNNSSLRLLSEADPNAVLYKDRFKSMCVLTQSYIQYRVQSTSSAHDNKILSELKENLSDFKCKDCIFSPVFQAEERKKFEARSEEYKPVFTCQRNRKTILVPKSRYPINDFHRSLKPQDIIMGQKGVQFFRQHFNYTPHRLPEMEINRCWYGDHHPLDIFVITRRYEDGSFDAKRVWITCFSDSASNCIVGYCLTTRPNASSIAEAFARAVAYTVDSPFYGLPNVIYIDNGKDFKSKKLKGVHYEHGIEIASDSDMPSCLSLNKTFEESGILEWFGCAVVHALPRNARAKTIERIFGTIEREWIKDLPGWCGNCPDKRPYSFNEDIKKGKLYSFEQFASDFADRILPAYHNYCGKSNGAKTEKGDPINPEKSPLEIYLTKQKELIDNGIKTIVPSWRTLAVLMVPSKKCKVSQNGLRFENHYYWHPALAQYMNEEVYVFAFDTPFHRRIAVTKDQTFIADAHPVKELHTLEQKYHQVINHIAEQRRQEKAVSKRLGILRKIVFTNGLLQKGTEVPAIIEYSYVPAVDEERDQTAFDNKKIPDEIKHQSQAYINSVISDPLEDKKKSSLDDIYLERGKQIIKENSFYPFLNSQTTSTENL